MVAGGGNNRIVIPGDDNGDWSINTGNGDDTVLALGGGDNSISRRGRAQCHRTWQREVGSSDHRR